MLHSALSGATKEGILLGHGLNTFQSGAIAAIAAGSYQDKDVSQIKGSGYVVESLEAALWCFFRTSSFTGAVLAAVNLGHDADTTAAICGQLAGAYYGGSEIPSKWRDRLARSNLIAELADHLYEQTNGAVVTN